MLFWVCELILLTGQLAKKRGLEIPADLRSMSPRMTIIEIAERMAKAGHWHLAIRVAEEAFYFEACSTAKANDIIRTSLLRLGHFEASKGYISADMCTKLSDLLSYGWLASSEVIGTPRQSSVAKPEYSEQYMPESGSLDYMDDLLAMASSSVFLDDHKLLIEYGSLQEWGLDNDIYHTSPLSMNTPLPLDHKSNCYAYGNIHPSISVLNTINACLAMNDRIQSGERRIGGLSNLSCALSMASTKSIYYAARIVRKKMGCPADELFKNISFLAVSKLRQLNFNRAAFSLLANMPDASDWRHPYYAAKLLIFEGKTDLAIQLLESALMLCQPKFKAKVVHLDAPYLIQVR